jgi:hypothetical protein
MASGWTILLLLLAVAFVIYLWQRNVRSIGELVGAVKTDVSRLSPRSQAEVAAAYAERARRRYRY